MGPSGPPGPQGERGLVGLPGARGERGPGGAAGQPVSQNEAKQQDYNNTYNCIYVKLAFDTQDCSKRE